MIEVLAPREVNGEMGKAETWLVAYKVGESASTFRHETWQGKT